MNNPSQHAALIAELQNVCSFQISPLFSPSFNPTTFITDCLSALTPGLHVELYTNSSLSTLRAELTVCVDKIRLFTIESLNKDYDKFVTLSTSLEAMGSKIAPILTVVSSISQRIEMCVDLLDSSISSTSSLLSQRTSVDQQLNMMKLSLLQSTLGQYFNSQLDNQIPNISPHTSSSTPPYRYNSIPSLLKSQDATLNSLKRTLTNPLSQHHQPAVKQPTLIAWDLLSYDLFRYDPFSYHFNTLHQFYELPPTNPHHSPAPPAVSSKFPPDIPFSHILHSHPTFRPFSSLLLQLEAKNHIISFLLDSLSEFHAALPPQNSLTYPQFAFQPKQYTNLNHILSSLSTFLNLIALNSITSTLPSSSSSLIQQQQQQQQQQQRHENAKNPHPSTSSSGLTSSQSQSTSYHPSDTPSISSVHSHATTSLHSAASPTQLINPLSNDLITMGLFTKEQLHIVSQLFLHCAVELLHIITTEDVFELSSHTRQYCHQNVDFDDSPSAPPTPSTPAITHHQQQPNSLTTLRQLMTLFKSPLPQTLSDPSSPRSRSHHTPHLQFQSASLSAHRPHSPSAPSASSLPSPHPTTHASPKSTPVPTTPKQPTSFLGINFFSDIIWYITSQLIDSVMAALSMGVGLEEQPDREWIEDQTGQSLPKLATQRAPPSKHFLLFGIDDNMVLQVSPPRYQDNTQTSHQQQHSQTPQISKPACFDFFFTYITNYHGSTHHHHRSSSAQPTHNPPQQRPPPRNPEETFVHPLDFQSFPFIQAQRIIPTHTFLPFTPSTPSPQPTDSQSPQASQTPLQYHFSISTLINQLPHQYAQFAEVFEQTLHLIHALSTFSHPPIQPLSGEFRSQCRRNDHPCNDSSSADFEFERQVAFTLLNSFLTTLSAHIDAQYTDYVAKAAQIYQLEQQRLEKQEQKQQQFDNRKSQLNIKSNPPSAQSAQKLQIPSADPPRPGNVASVAASVPPLRHYYTKMNIPLVCEQYFLSLLLRICVVQINTYFPVNQGSSEPKRSISTPTHLSSLITLPPTSLSFPILTELTTNLDTTHIALTDMGQQILKDYCSIVLKYTNQHMLTVPKPSSNQPIQIESQNAPGTSSQTTQSATAQSNVAKHPSNLTTPLLIPNTQNPQSQQQIQPKSNSNLVSPSSSSSLSKSQFTAFSTPSPRSLVQQHQAICKTFTLTTSYTPTFFTLPKRPTSVILFLLHNLSSLGYQNAIPFTQYSQLSQLNGVSNSIPSASSSFPPSSTPHHTHFVSLPSQPNPLITIQPKLDENFSATFISTSYSLLMILINLHCRFHNQSTIPIGKLLHLVHDHVVFQNLPQFITNFVYSMTPNSYHHFQTQITENSSHLTKQSSHTDISLSQSYSNHSNNASAHSNTATNPLTTNPLTNNSSNPLSTPADTPILSNTYSTASLTSLTTPPSPSASTRPNLLKTTYEPHLSAAQPPFLHPFPRQLKLGFKSVLDSLTQHLNISSYLIFNTIDKNKRALHRAKFLLASPLDLPNLPHLARTPTKLPPKGLDNDNGHAISFATAIISLTTSLTFCHCLSTSLNALHLASITNLSPLLITAEFDESTSRTSEQSLNPILPAPKLSPPPHHQLALSMTNQFSPLALYLLTHSATNFSTYLVQHLYTVLTSPDPLHLSQHAPGTQAAMNTTFTPNPRQFYLDLLHFHCVLLKLPYQSPLFSNANAAVLFGKSDLDAFRKPSAKTNTAWFPDEESIPPLPDTFYSTDANGKLVSESLNEQQLHNSREPLSLSTRFIQQLRARILSGNEDESVHRDNDDDRDGDDDVCETQTGLDSADSLPSLIQRYLTKYNFLPPSVDGEYSTRQTSQPSIPSFVWTEFSHLFPKQPTVHSNQPQSQLLSPTSSSHAEFLTSLSNCAPITDPSFTTAIQDRFYSTYAPQDDVMVLNNIPLHSHFFTLPSATIFHSLLQQFESVHHPCHFLEQPRSTVGDSGNPDQHRASIPLNPSPANSHQTPTPRSLPPCALQTPSFLPLSTTIALTTTQLFLHHLPHFFSSFSTLPSPKQFNVPAVNSHGDTGLQINNSTPQYSFGTAEKALFFHTFAHSLLYILSFELLNLATLVQALPELHTMQDVIGGQNLSVLAKDLESGVQFVILSMHLLKSSTHHTKLPPWIYHCLNYVFKDKNSGRKQNESNQSALAPVSAATTTRPTASQSHQPTASTSKQQNDEQQAPSQTNRDSNLTQPNPSETLQNKFFKMMG